MLLLTGAAGFIGSNVLAALNQQGRDDIICVDDLTDGAKCLNLAAKRFADYIDYQELLDETCGAHFHRLTGIIHLGGNSSTTATDGRDIVRSNFTFTKRMIALAEQHECPIVYASSASVYGNGLKGFQEIPECEAPASPYAVSKWMIDQYVRYATTHRYGHITVPVAGLRYFNVFGPGEEHKGSMASFAHKLFVAAKTNKPVQLFAGSEDIRRDFIYVQDAVDITLFILQAKVTGIYNVGTGIATSFADMLEYGKTALSALNMSWPQVQTVVTPVITQAQYQKYTCADTTKLKVVGWTKFKYPNPQPAIINFFKRLST